MNKTLKDFTIPSNSISLKALDDVREGFTVITADRSEYDGNDGVILTMDRQYQIERDGQTGMYNMFHTTRQAVTQFFLRESVQTALKAGQKIGPLKMTKKKSKNNRDVFVLIDA